MVMSVRSGTLRTARPLVMDCAISAAGPLSAPGPLCLSRDKCFRGMEDVRRGRWWAGLPRLVNSDQRMQSESVSLPDSLQQVTNVLFWAEVWAGWGGWAHSWAG